jgi:uncharacterized RDD family membrane protein YckC
VKYGGIAMLVLFLLVVITFGFLGVPFWSWTVLGAVAIYLSQGAEPSYFCWGLFAAVALIGNIPLLRRILVSSMVMKVMKSFIPSKNKKALRPEINILLPPQERSSSRRELLRNRM